MDHETSKAAFSPRRRFNPSRLQLAIAILAVAFLAFLISAQWSASADSSTRGEKKETVLAQVNPTVSKAKPAAPTSRFETSLTKRPKLHPAIENAIFGSASILAPAPEPQATPRTMIINFDNLNWGTNVSNLYQEAKFISPPFTAGGPNLPMWVVSQNSPRTLPHFIVAGSSATALNSWLDFQVDFPKPVDNLRFFITGVDSFFGVTFARYDLYRNNQLVHSFQPIQANGTFKELFFSMTGITRVKIHTINDALGLGYDDFSFTIPAASPTPTPTPTPNPTPTPTPMPPMGVTASSDIEAVTLTWPAVPNISSYNVKRRASSETNFTTIANVSGSTATLQYRDTSANPYVQYTYVVTSFQVNCSPNFVNCASGLGESIPSSPVTIELLAPCGPHVEPRDKGIFGTIENAGHGWTMNAAITDREGLLFSDVTLNNRYMAKKMSVPYFTVKTSKMSSAEKGHLTPDGNQTTLRTRLVESGEWIYGASQRKGGGTATYAIDRLSPTSKSCLYITQNYEFMEMVPKDLCNPKGTFPCSRFFPKITYNFVSRNGEVLQDINIPIRLHYRVDAQPHGTIGLFRDCDVFPCGIIRRSVNPLPNEAHVRVITGGKDIGSWDNIHQTNWEHVTHPLDTGCPECVHMHWRWGAWLSTADIHGYGVPLIGKTLLQTERTPSGPITRLMVPPSNQDLELGILRYKELEEGSDAPFNTFIENEGLRTWVEYTTVSPPPTRPPFFSSLRRTVVNRPADVVYWYSATSHEPVWDLFFLHGAFFNPQFVPNVVHAVAGSDMSGATTASLATQDGIKAIKYGFVYHDGPTTFTPVDPNSLPPLPPGYVPLSNTAINVTTTSVVSGPHVVSFDVPTITDETTFNNLSIFHLERDQFDPDNKVWVDVSIVSPDTPGFDFANKLIHGRVAEAGHFVVGRFVQTQPNPGSSDLRVTLNDSPDPVNAEANVTYSLRITNAGPQTAPEAGIVDALPHDMTFVSATSTKGTCKVREGNVYCKFGNVLKDENVDVTIVATARESQTGSSGTTLNSSVVVAAGNDDPNLDNNVAQTSTLLNPNPNKKPSVVITSPTVDQDLVGPVTIPIRVTATDTDGVVSSVALFEGTQSIGTATPTGVANQYGVSWNASPGSHSLTAVATDNGGRTNETSIHFFVNGNGTVQITSPAMDSVITPSSNIWVMATASSPSGAIESVEFFANTLALGVSTQPDFSGRYFVMWNDVRSGQYLLTAVLKDAAGVITKSAPVNIYVSRPPTVAISSPGESTVFGSKPQIQVIAAAQDPDGIVNKVDFFANGTLLGKGTLIGPDRYSFDWVQPADGAYSLTAVVTDDVGLQVTSAPVNVGVNKQPARPGEVIWFDDALPPGAVKRFDGDVDWYWVDANPGAFSGTKAHQSRNFKAVVPPARTIHSHSFDSATSKLRVDAGDRLFTYVFLDPNRMPRQIMLEWKDASGWEHRAYWGANNIDVGINNTASRFYMGSLPNAGGWVRLDVLASNVGLVNTDLDGMSFVLDGGRATWDVSGKTTPAYVPPTPPPPILMPTEFPNVFFVGDWMMDSLPPGGVPGVENNDVWNWIPCPTSWRKCHQSVSGQGFKRHYFTGASPLTILPGDHLFAYVFLDPHQMPDQLFLEWHDGAKWHRAFWGANAFEVGTTGTENWRYMGGLPTAGQWAALEVPASYVGLEGKFVSGMGFGFYKERNNAQVLWAQAGTTKFRGSVPLTLSAVTAVYQFKHENFGYYYSTKDVPLHSTQDRQDGWKFFAPPNQAAGTVPMFRFVNANEAKREFVYTTCANCPNPNDWRPQGIAFYVYPTPAPGTVPLYLFRDSAQHYFLTINQSDGAGMTAETPPISGYVYPDNPLVPARPSPLSWFVNFCSLHWRDNASNETGYRIERKNFATNTWGTLVNLPPNTTSFKDCNLVKSSLFSGSTNLVNPSNSSSDPNQPETVSGNTNLTNQSSPIDPIEPNMMFPPDNVFRVFAVNSVGDSLPGDQDFAGWVFFDTTIDNSEPAVNIVSPKEGEIVGRDLVIKADGFDVNGNGSLGKIEFFDGVKLGELTGPPPYNFIWKNAAPGPHTITVKATDGMGVTVTSAPVHITVTALPTVAITSPADGAVVTAPATITLQANASDADGSISKVEFFQGEVKIGEDSTVPYSVNWSGAQSGTYLITARATDNLGMKVDSIPVWITVNNPPSVELSLYSESNPIQPGGEALLLTSVTDSDGTISKVDFYRGTTLIGTSTTFPFTYTWTNIPSGNHSLTAKATDNKGATSTSAAVSLVVNTPPSVSISSPVNQAIIATSSNIAINATAGDTDGAVNKVDFYQGANLLGTDTTSPFSITWNNVPAGTYVLTAKATDDKGAVTTSSPVVISAAAFFDDFNDNSLNSTNWQVMTPSSAVVVSEQGQQLRITVPASAAGYNGVTSKSSYDIRGGSVQVQLVQPVSQAGWVENYLQVLLDSQNYLLINVGAGGTLLRSMVNGANDQVIIPFDGVAHRYWQIRHAQSTNAVSFETSPDGVTWTTRKTATAGFSLAAVKFQLVAGAYGTGNGAPGAAIYDNFQVQGAVVANALPTVSITSPVNNAPFTAPANITINANANDSDGTVTKVDFYQGTSLIGTDTASPYTFNWNSVGIGTYPLTAKATDNSGAVTTSSSINVTVGAPNNPPAVNITLPANNATFTAPANLTINASASDSDGAISKVDFYQGSSLIGTATTSPYSVSWTNIPAGTYTLTAKATDNSGAVTTSTAVNVISNAAPSVAITSPTSAASFSAPANLTINANASDADGTVTQVEFYQGSTLLGTDTSSPFSVAWNNVPVGSYDLFVKATDNRGAVSVSSFVTINVTGFFDDFNDNSLDSTKWALVTGLSPVVVSEQVQQLRITLPANMAAYNGVVTKSSYDIRGGSIQLQMVQSVSQAGWAENSLQVLLDPQNYLLINVGAGGTLFRSMVNGVNDQVIIPFDGVAHRYWRIRHTLSTNSLSFDTSPNGATWTTRKSATAGFSLAAVKVQLVAGAYGTGNGAPGAAIYDDFQVQGTAVNLPILADNFNDNALNTANWDPNNLFSGLTDTNLAFAETGQRFEVGPLLQNTGSSHYRGIRTVNIYTFTDSYAHVELVQPAASNTAADAMFTIGNSVDSYYRLYVSGNTLFGQRKIGATKTTLFSLPYDPVNHRFLRIRHEGATGKAVLETAPGTSGVPGPWIQRYNDTWDPSVSLTGVIFEMKAGTWQVEANAAGKVIFDNFQFGRSN